MTALIVTLLMTSAHAFFTPGTYEIESHEGRSLGRMEFSVSTATIDDMPTRVFRKSTTYYASHITEVEVAYVNNEGLRSFKREITDGKKKSIRQGERRGDEMKLYVIENGNSIGTVVPLSTIDITEYEAEFPASPYWGLKLKDVKSMRIFVVDDFASLKTRRSVAKQTTGEYNGKETDVYVAHTNLEGRVITSWFTVDGHILLKMRWPDRIFLRVE